MTTAAGRPEAYWAGGRLIEIKHVADDPELPSITESLLRAGQGPAEFLHRYVTFDTYVLEGTLTVSVGGEIRELSVGDVSHVPVGVPQTYLVGPEGARVLQVTTPGHPWVNYFRALGAPATGPTLPPSTFEAVPMEVVHRLAQANGLEFVGGRLPGASREGVPD
jgi:quercetin dioxygenase-like cupin family protein